jgi:hypothetical protein
MVGFWMVEPIMAGARMAGRPAILGSLFVAGVPIAAGAHSRERLVRGLRSVWSVRAERRGRGERRARSESLPARPSSPNSARFVTAVVLTKHEAFDICEALAESERTLLRSGHAGPAARLAAMFEMIEGRLIADP